MIPSKSTTVAGSRPPASPMPAAAAANASTHPHTSSRSSHSRSQSNVTLVDANPNPDGPPSSSKPAAASPAADSDPPSPHSCWLTRVLLPHLVPPLVSLAVILVVFPLTFLAGPSLPPVAKIAVSVALAAQLCYACLHVTPSPGRQQHRYQALHPTSSLSSATSPTRTLMLASTYALRTLLPVFSWLVLFSLLKHMPAGRMSAVDTITLPAVDTWLVGKPAYEYFAPARDSDASVAVDVVAWFTYGVWHFVSPLACCLVVGVVGVRRARKGTGGQKGQVELDEVVVVWENDSTSERPINDEVVELTMVASPETTDVDSDADSDDTLSEIVIVSNRPSPPPPQLGLSPIPTGAARLASALSSITLLSTLHPIHTFLTCFGSMNLCGVMIQYVYPTAPPWYNQHFGSTVPLNPLLVHGDPAGLARIDVLLGAPVYKHMFASSPVVFGAWPSLHAGFATMCALAVGASMWRQGPTPTPTPMRTPTQWLWNAGVASVAVGYVALVWWATMYLCHHFLVDVLAGSAIALGMYSGVGWVKRWRMASVEFGGGEYLDHADQRAAESAAAATTVTGLWAVPARGDGRLRRGTGASDVTLA